jgi:hypothetical protein
MHQASWRIEYDTAQLVPGWRELVGGPFRLRGLPVAKLEVEKHPLGGLRLRLLHECREPCPWTSDVFENAAFDATQALRRAWDARDVAPGAADFVVFYSWQSTSAKTNRNLIEAALKRAISQLKKDDAITVEPVIDRDTAGVAGSPDIAATIFGKIETASVFVADVSLVLRDVEAGRSSPNPNVLLEVGYAAHALGWDRILLVANTHFGEVEQLPFDLRPRRVAKYEMGPDDQPANARNNLSAQLEDRLRHAITLGERRAGEPSLRDKIRRLVAEVSKANSASYAPTMLASTLRYPGVSREEYARRLAVTLPHLQGLGSMQIPDPATKQTGLCKGETVHVTGVDDDTLSLEIPPHRLQVRVPLDQVTSVWRHNHWQMGMRLAVAIVVPEGSNRPLTLEAE